MLDGDDAVCPLCGAAVKKDGVTEITFEVSDVKTRDAVFSGENTEPEQGVCADTKSRLTAGFLQIFLGALGVGRFYMGYSGIGIAQIVLSAATCGLGGFIWGFIDGILILNGSPQRDAKGKELV